MVNTINIPLLLPFQAMMRPTLLLKTPYTMVISGQTGSGKTVFVTKLIRSQMELHDPPFEKILYCYSVFQPVFKELLYEVPGLDLVEGFPNDFYDSLQTKSSAENTLLVLDDMMIDLENDKRLPVLFTKMRHKNISTLFIFFTSKYMRTITRNAHYIVLFSNPRDKTMISTLGRQMFPEAPNFVADAFRQATSAPYGYLFIDCKPGTDEQTRVREGIFPDDQCIVYRPT